MGVSRAILSEIGREMGFSWDNGNVTLNVGNNDMQHMRGDVRNLGNDMRNVLNSRTWASK